MKNLKELFLVLIGKSNNPKDFESFFSEVLKINPEMSKSHALKSLLLWAYVAGELKSNTENLRSSLWFGVLFFLLLVLNITITINHA